MFGTLLSPLPSGADSNDIEILWNTLELLLFILFRLNRDFDLVQRTRGHRSEHGSVNCLFV